MYMNQGLKYGQASVAVQSVRNQGMSERKQRLLHKYKSQIRDFGGSSLAERMGGYAPIADYSSVVTIKATSSKGKPHSN